jgi:hypothetical protein
MNIMESLWKVTTELGETFELPLSQMMTFLERSRG